MLRSKYNLSCVRHPPPLQYTVFTHIWQTLVVILVYVT